MPDTAKRQAVYEDLYHIPENTTGEIIDGELIVSPRPGIPHAECASTLGAELIFPYRFGRGGPGGWIIIDEPELHLGAHVIVPDLAGWRKERVAGLLSAPHLTVPPDWACEILSPSSVRIDRIKKMRIFADHGVPYAWLLDPFLKTLEVYRLQAGKWLLLGAYADDEKVLAEPFTEVELALGNLWIEGPVENF